jgi:hypothetical protein
VGRQKRTEAVAYATFSARFLTLDFVSLVEGMAQIEEQLRQDLHLALLNSLTSAGAEIRGDVITLGSYPYKLFVTLAPGTRRLDVVLANLAQRGRMRESVESVEGFGLVKEITFELPGVLPRVHEPLIYEAMTHYRRAYTALETAYVTTYGDWVATLFSTAYGIVNTELLLRGHPHLRDRFWFSVTDLSGMKFRYHFSRENLASTVAWLTANQDELVSPCAAATLLITEDVSDGVIGIPAPKNTHRYDDSTLIVDFTALPTLGVNTAFWVAEHTLFESRALAAVHLVDIADRAFELNCPADVVAAFTEVIDGCRDDLVHVVTEQYSAFVRQQRKLYEAVERATHSMSWMREMGTDFAAKVLAELAKP